MSFLDAYFLWRDPLAAAAVAAALCGYLGVFVVLRRVAFVSAVLSQISGLGVALAFLLGSIAGVDPHSGSTPWYLSPALFALVLTCAASIALGLPARARRISPETLVAFAYVAASASVVLVLASPRIVQEAHEVGELLFGNAVAVREEHLVDLAIAAVAIALVHAVFFKDFLFVSFDGETARSVGYPVTLLDAALHLTLAVAVAVATRAIGTLPVFAFLVLPAGAALLWSQRIRVVVVLSVTIAVVAAALGYYLSFVYQLPTGPTMAALCAAAWLPGLRLFRRRP
ncbi:MAG: iron chelate uptake ABC transporter family permease subunit [Myxococcales bacterium]